MLHVLRDFQLQLNVISSNVQMEYKNTVQNETERTKKMEEK